MSDAGEWMRLDDAAKALGVSDRTLRRHLSEGRYQQSQDDEGYKRVFVSDDRKVTGQSGQFPEDGQENAVILRQMADGAIEIYRQQLDRVHDQIHAVRRSASIAWCCVGLVVIGLGLCGWRLMAQHGRASLAEKDAQTAATMATDARRAVSDIRAMLKTADERADQANARAQQANDETKKWQTKAVEATERTHHLELQLANLEAAVERDRMAAVTQIQPEVSEQTSTP